MEKFWKEHHNDDQWNTFIENYFKYLEEKKVEWTEEHSNNGVFGISKASGCTRNNTLGLLGYPGEEFSGSTRFTFFLGHNVECMALATLDGVGYTVTNTQKHVGMDGLFSSAIDGEINYLGEPTIVSVKSSAYKMSSKSRGKFMRRGFAELPFTGVAAGQPSWYMQGNLEAYLLGYKQWMCVVASKDIVKAFEDDDYLGEKGNGSLTFYTELLRVNTEHAAMAIKVHEQAMEDFNNGVAGDPLYYVPGRGYQVLNKAEYIPSNIWGGKNKEITGTFNPCGGCARREPCSEVV